MVGVQLFHLASFLSTSSVQTNDIFLLHNLKTRPNKMA